MNSRHDLGVIVTVGAVLLIVFVAIPLLAQQGDLHRGLGASVAPPEPVVAQSFGGLEWAPDSSALLAESPDRLIVVSAQGANLAMIQGDRGAWMGANAIVAWSTEPGNPTTGTVARYGVDGHQIDSLSDEFGPPVASQAQDHVMLPTVGAATSSYRVWATDGLLTGLRPGVPLAMNAGMVAVLTPAVPDVGGPGLTGRLSMVSEDGKVLHSFEGVLASSASLPVFSTSGRYLALCGSVAVEDGCGLTVLDTATGKASFLGQPATVFSWLPGDHLLASSGAGPVIEWSAGVATATNLPAASYALGSTKGEVAVWWPDDRPMIRLISNSGIEHDVPLPGDLAGNLVWSPDGTRLALVTWLADKSHGQQLSVMWTGNQ